jgi:hypothetical protein
LIKIQKAYESNLNQDGLALELGKICEEWISPQRIQNINSSQKSQENIEEENWRLAKENVDLAKQIWSSDQKKEKISSRDLVSDIYRKNYCEEESRTEEESIILLLELSRLWKEIQKKDGSGEEMSSNPVSKRFRWVLIVGITPLINPYLLAVTARIYWSKWNLSWQALLV